ncbi:MAG: hypothetical protein JEZ06_14460 [Anaerolineaceae bacterium]|nr:hypothetical protein [Anaerolineaceae bacterium]
MSTAEQPEKKKENQMSEQTWAIAIVMGIVVICIVVTSMYMFLMGFGIFGIRSQDQSGPVSVTYDNLPSYNGKEVVVAGYIIIPKTDSVCFSGWPTCKLWFDFDPYEEGKGTHEVSIKVGEASNTITTDGILRANNGSHLTLKSTDIMQWYHVRVSGKVTKCSGQECTIEVDTIYGLQ